MLTKAELVDAREELLNGKSTIQNCEKLAAVCTVLDHCYGENNSDFVMKYSGDNVKHYGESQFLRKIEGMNPDDLFPLLDELVTTVQIVNPRLYAGFMRKLTTY